MRTYLISFTVMFLLFGCVSKDKNASANETKNERFIQKDSSNIDSTAITTDNISCDFERFLKDPNVPKLAKDLLNNTAKNPSDNEALAYFDKLKSKDFQERAFYFKAITNSYKIADGAYAEGLGFTSKEFIESNPTVFASFFDSKNCFSKNDLETWADILILEFAIDNEGENDISFIDDYIKKIVSNCGDCSISNIETIRSFDSILQKKWKNYLKSIE